MLRSKVTKRGALAATIAVLLAAGDADAASRRRFDPDDLELDGAGVLKADVAFGPMRGTDAGRWLVPDFDVDLGITSNVELGLDGAWAVEGTPARPFAFDHRLPDPLWLSSKMELTDWKSDDGKKARAIGVQLGPRFSVDPGTHGAGFQALVLGGTRFGRARTVLNAGGLVDPGTTQTSGRPLAVLGGVDLSVDLDDDGRWSIDADLSFVHFFSADDDQLTTTFGPVFQATSWLELSVDALLGALPGGDRYGAFLQVSPKIPLF